MTGLVRVRTAAAVPAGFHGQGRIARSLELLQGRTAGTLEFKSTVWKAAKGQLKRESGGKCAYCESPTDTVAHGDVEHFRPKSVYWWLAYCYDNYLYSCQICNEVFKGDEFPTHSSSGKWTGPVLPAPGNAAALAAALTAMAPALTPDGIDTTLGHAAFITATKKELAGLVDPYVVDPDPLFKWVADDALKEVEIRAASNLTAPKRAFAAVEKYYGLNREELKRWRWKTYSTLVTFRDVLQALAAANADQALQTKIRSQIQAMTLSDAPYAGMVRYFVTKFGI